MNKTISSFDIVRGRQDNFEPESDRPGEEMPKITLYTRSECHLCDEAKTAVMRHFPDLAIDEVDVDTDPELVRQYGEEVPVGYLGETKVFKYHLDVKRLRRLLDETEP